MTQRAHILPALAVALAIVLLSSCSSRKKVPVSPEFQEITTSSNPVVREALTWLGTPYGYGCSERGKATDCSGMVWQVHRKFGIELPRNSSAQADKCRVIKQKEMAEGDLVFFNIHGSRISHVGIYVGDGQFIHASTRKGVIISRLSEPYYASRFHSARRVNKRRESERPEPTPIPVPTTIPEPVPLPEPLPAPLPAPVADTLRDTVPAPLPVILPDTLPPQPERVPDGSIDSEVRNAFAIF